MPSKCSVPACRGNYDESTKVAVFSFPNDERLREKWLHAIRRTDFKITKNSKVCEKHFKDGEVLRNSTFYNEKTGETISAPLKRPKLKENAVPSIFPGCPSYMSSSSAIRESPSKKRQRLEQEQINFAVKESLNSKHEYELKTMFTNFAEFRNCIKGHSFSSFWTVVEKNENMLFLNLSLKDDIPSIKYAVSVSNDLMLNASFMGERISKYKKVILPIKVNNLNEIFDILEYFEKGTIVESESSLNDKIHVIESVIKNAEDIFTDKNKFFFEFFLEQLHLLKCKPERYRYSPNILVFASLLFYMSPQAYKFLRNSHYMILPDPSTIRKIGTILKNSPQTEEYTNFLVYAKHAFHSLKDDDLKVFLMIDEIHIKPFLDYKGGNIVGMAYNSSNLATSVQVFMLQSLFSPYKDVIHIVPIDTFDASKLFDLMKKVIMGLEEIGFKVMGMVTDNNSINRAAASNFANPPKLQVKYDHPADKSRPLFYVIDSVHILKCVRNNWLNNHKNGYYFYYPDFDTLNVSTASLSSVRKLYDLECSSLLKFGYGLTRKALWPTNLERQNVKLALKLFSTDVVHALNELGEKYNLECYEQTAKFINIISTWWDIVNVKTPDKGKFKRNPMCEPLTSSPSDKGLMFLKQLVSWVNKWENLDSNNGRLSKETFLALNHTTQAFIEIVNHCTKSFKKEYILLGKIQTDKLESRFGQYRSMAGDQYHISVRQIYETESKLRLCHELKLASHKKGSITVDIFDNSEKNDEEKQPIDLIFCDIMVEESDIEKIADTLPIVTYLAGYCSHAALKKTKCSYCRQKLITDKESISHDNYKLIDVKDRGGLLYPSKIVVNAVIHTYIVVQKLISEKYEDKFIQVLNQRSLVVNLVEDILVTKDIFLSFDVCVDGHDILHLINIILRSATNSLLNNYCKVKNDKLKKIPNVTVVSKNKRKLETFSKNSLSDKRESSKKSNKLKEGTMPRIAEVSEKNSVNDEGEAGEKQNFILTN
ncbi:hypothetical protein AVEN_172191-1 [Araneus ventricosus]|uniref:THAP-type domain-containing protein n=2 Tax=Araneus ventricosus TaxID=182803 RepID=A0A4Y2FJW3_ARAVE|nr:hypothetical protein AVEN_82876-1 [Araneus ventricosus]GBO03917.1 hypothetical protein AVEN_172191-1 [Araneus ventricosus]